MAHPRVIWCIWPLVCNHIYHECKYTTDYSWNNVFHYHANENNGGIDKNNKKPPNTLLKYSIAIVRLISGIPPKIEQMQHVINDIIVKSKIYIRS